MADYDWQAIARATGWELVEQTRPFPNPLPTLLDRTVADMTFTRYPSEGVSDALAALEATGREVDLHRTVGEPGNYRWWCSIHLVDEAGRPKGTVSGSGGCCEAICRALEAYGKALMGKEEDDG